VFSEVVSIFMVVFGIVQLIATVVLSRRRYRKVEREVELYLAVRRSLTEELHHFSAWQQSEGKVNWKKEGF